MSKPAEEQKVKQVRDISWKHVTIIVSFFAVVGLLSATGRDTGAFVAVGLGVLGGLGLIVAQVASTKEAANATHQQSNGNLSRMMDIIEKQGAMLAAMQPAPPPPAAPAAEDEQQPA